MKGERKVKSNISLIIVLLIVIQSFVTVVATDDMAFNTLKLEMNLTVLKKAGIIETSDAENVDNSITRAEFAVWAAKALKLEGTTDKTYFSDMSVNHWALAYVNALVDIGVISKNGGGLFNPDEYITYDQVCKMLCVMTGYAGFNSKPQNMNEYTMIAKRVGFDCDVADLTSLTVGEAATMLYRAMTCPKAVAVGVIGDEIVRVGGSDITLFEAYFDIYVGRAVVETVYSGSINDEIVEENEAVIGGVKFSIDSDVKIEDYLGQTVELIYSIKNEKYFLHYVLPRYENDRLEIMSAMIENYNPSARVIEYIKGNAVNRLSKATIAQGATVIYNGYAFEGEISDKIAEFISEERKGRIVLIDTNGGSHYNMVRIESYDVFVLGSKLSKDKVVYDYYDKQKWFCFDDYDNVEIVNADGEKIELGSEIPTVFLVAESDGGERLSFVLCENIVTGRIDAIRTKNEIYVDGSPEKIDKDIYNYIKKIITVGSTYKLTYDKFDEIVFAEKTLDVAGTMQLGYVVGVACVNDTFSSLIKAKIYTQNGEFKIYDFAEKVNIDGSIYNTANPVSVFGAFPGNSANSVERQLVRFAINGKSKIFKIDTYNFVSSKEVKSNTLKRIVSSDKETEYLPNRSTFGNTAVYSPTHTKVFVVPKIETSGAVMINGFSAGESEAMYATKLSELRGAKYFVDAFKFDNTNPFADVIVVKENLNRTGLLSEDYKWKYAYMVMFDQLQQILGEDGEIVTIMTGCSNRGDEKREVYDEALAQVNELKQGDIIQIWVDASGKIFAVNKVYDGNTLTFGDNYNIYNATETTNKPDRQWYRYDSDPDVMFQLDNQAVELVPVKELGGVMFFANDFAGASQDECDLAVKYEYVKVIVFDKDAVNEDEKVYVGTVDDIVKYANAGTNCDSVLVETGMYYIYAMYVFK